MKLLEAAQVNQGSERWTSGYNSTARECGVNLRLTDACEETSVDLVGTDASEASAYHVNPFSIEAQLNRSVLCERPDDQAWVEKALEANLEYPLSRALVIQPIAETDSWLNHADVQEVALAGNTADNYRTAVVAARKLWYESVLSLEGQPIFHVPPSIAPILVTAGVLQIDGGGKAVTIWGEPVVISNGYEMSTPRAFFTGPIKIEYTSVQSNDILRHARMNNSSIVANVLAIVDTPPCAIVRIGDYA
jgi:hypothetical protein